MVVLGGGGAVGVQGGLVGDRFLAGGGGWGGVEEKTGY